MKQRNISKIFWTEALTGGLILGVALFVWDLIGYWLNMPMNYSGAASFVQFVLLAGGIFYFGRRMRDLRGPVLGFPYASAFGFVMGMMLFTGAIYGVGQFFLQVVIAPEYFDELTEITLLNSNLDENLVEQALTMRESMGGLMKNPLIFIFSGIFTILIYGGLVGLIVSAFLKRPADPFADNSENDYNPEF